MHSFPQAALALNEDWGTQLDGKQVQRWAEAIGRTVVSARETHRCEHTSKVIDRRRC